MECLTGEATKSNKAEIIGVLTVLSKRAMSTLVWPLSYLASRTRKRRIRSQAAWLFSYKRIASFNLLLSLVILSIFSSVKPAQAQIDQAMAINAIVGEAEDQGLTGMTAVAEAIRNRGTLSGVYGLKSPRLKKAPKWVFAMASKAWEKSEKSNLVKGADHWESTDFKTPKWSKGMVQTAHIGKHKFYREVVK